MKRQEKYSHRLHKIIRAKQETISSKQRRAVRAGVSDDVAKFLASGGEVKQV